MSHPFSSSHVMETGTSGTLSEFALGGSPSGPCHLPREAYMMLLSSGTRMQTTTDCLTDCLTDLPLADHLADCPLCQAYDIYKPSSSFSRRKPSPRMCSVCVCVAGRLPSLQDTLSLSRHGGDAPLRFAVVDCGDVLFYDVCTAPAVVPDLATPGGD
jgi:hypothetical protein